MVRRYIARRMLPLWLLLAIGIAFGTQQSGLLTSVSHSAQAVQPGLYSINHFVDGDTIAVNMNGKTETIRLIGVDTPETHKPNTPVQCYGEAAAAFTKRTIGSTHVRLVADSQSDNRDLYGRLVRYVYLPDGRNLDELLIQNGYGFAYLYFPFSQSVEFAADQQQAQATQKGLWRTCRPYQESNGRWQTEPAPG